MLYTLIKALVFSCSSYPKICAPHRFTLSRDYDLCILSGLLAVSSINNYVDNVIEEYKYGKRSISDLEIGKVMNMVFIEGLRDLGTQFNVIIGVTSVIATYIAHHVQKMGTNFHDSLRNIYRSMMFNKTEDSIEMIRGLRRFGGEITHILDQIGLSERRIAIEDLKIFDIIKLLGEQHPGFKSLSQIQRMVNILGLAEKIFKELRDLNTTLSIVSLQLAKEELGIDIDLTKRDPRYFAELLRIDREYRKKGIDLEYIMPYIVTSSLYLVLTQ